MGSRVDVKPVCLGRVVGLSLGKFAYVGGVLGLLALAAPALAGPEGENVVAGSAQFARQGDLTVIHAADRTIIDYASFNIAQHESVQFVQPSSTARVLNRVYGQLPTHIDGTLTANGMVYFANPAGIYFGGQAIVNVGGLVAAAGTITNADFLSGVDHFSNLSGSVENLGTIHAQTVHLVGRHVLNRGTVISPGGLVTMTAGEDVYLGKRDGHLFVRIEGAAAKGGGSAGVENSGTIAAAGGRAVMMAGDMAGLAIKQSGTVQAADIHLEGAGKGEVRVTGLLDASDKFFGRGGDVTVTGQQVSLDDAVVDVSGTFGGGSVRIGGDYQGGGTLRTSELTFVSSDSRISADAIVDGNGGRVIVWGDRVTAFGGEISARGGSMGGDGGFAEVSGKEHLIFQGKVDLRAPKGARGTLLLDPTNIIVDDTGTETSDLTDVDDFTDPDIAGGGSNNAILDVAAINGAAAMADVILRATNNITFNAPVATAADGVSLTAEAGGNITVNESITLRGGTLTFTAGSADPDATQSATGSIVINAPISTAGGGLTGGDIQLNVDSPDGTITLGADLITAGGTVTLANDAIVLTANVAIDTDPAGGNTNAGQIVFAGNSTTTGAFTLTLDASADGAGTAANVNLGAVDGPTALTVAGSNLALRGDLRIDGDIDLRTGLGSITLFDNEQPGMGGTGTQIDSSGGTNAAISIADTAGAFDLDLIGDAASVVTFDDLDVASLDVTGTVTMAGDVTADGEVDLRTGVTALTLSGNRTIDTTGASAGDGDILLRGLTSNTVLTLNAEAGSNITLGLTDVDTLNLSGGTLTLLADVISDKPLDFTSVGAITLGGPVSITAADSDAANAAQNITFDAGNVITGAQTLAIDGNTVTLFGVGNGTSDPTSLTVAADTVLNLSGNVTVDGAVDLRTGVASLNLVGNRTINTSGASAGAGTIMLRGLTSASALTLNAEDASAITLGLVDVDALNLLGGGTLNLLASVTSDTALDFSNVGQIALGGPVTITARDSDAGNAARNVTFGTANIITGAQSVTIDGATVTVRQVGGVGADPTALNVTAETAFVLNGSIQVDGPVDLRTNVAAITLSGNSTIDVTGGTNAAISLADATGDFNLGLTGDLGSALTLGATDVNGLSLTGGAVSLNGNITSDTALDFTSAGAIDFTGPTTITADNAGTAQNITFDAGNVITGDDALVLDGATVTLFDVGDGASDPTSLSVTATALSLNGDITVDGPADLRTNVGSITLGANASVNTSGGTNAAISLADVSGDFDLTLTGDVGGSAITLEAVDVNSLAMTGGALTLNDDVTTDGALDFTNVEAIAFVGDVTITARDGATAANIVTDANNVFTGSGALAFNGDDITLFQVGSGGVNPSSVDIAADGAVTLNATVTSAGNITLRPGTAGTTIALHDGTGAFSITAASLGQLSTTAAVIIGDAASGAINVAGNGLIDLTGAGYDLTLRGASVTFNTAANDGIQLATDGALRIETFSGGVLTNGGTNADVIIPGANGTLIVDAAGTIGTSPDPLSTEIGRFAADTTGGIFLANTGGLTIASAGGVVGVTTGADADIVISAASPIVVDSPMTAMGTGEITLHATGGDTGDLTVNAAITSEDGDINLRADNDATFSAAGDVTSTSGAINVVADFDMANSGGAGTGGALTMADGTVFTTDGNITVSSDGDLTLGSLLATDGAADVDVTSVSGDIVDGNDNTAGNNVTHAAGAGTTTLTASMGAVGAGGNGLELELNGSNLAVNAQDGLALAVTGDLAGAFTITNGFLDLTADGTISTTGAWLAETIALHAGDVSINHTITGGTSVTIDLDAPGTIGVGTATGDLTVSNAELAMITTPSLTIGGANTTTMTVDAVTAADTAGIDLTTLAAAGDVVFSGAKSFFQNAMAVQADDGVTVEVDLETVAGALSIDGDANDAADAFDGVNVSPNVTITSGGNLTTAATTGGVSLGDGVTLTSLGTIFLQDATVAQGGLAVEAFNGISVNGALAATNGAVTLDADSNANGFGTLTVGASGSIDAAGQALTLTAADMDLLGGVTTTGGTLTIMRASGGSIGLGDAAGDLRLDNTDLGNITADDATIGGASVTALTADNAAAPNITGTLTLDATGGAATFENGDSSFGGALDVTATAVTFDAGVTTGGALTASSDQDLRIGGVALVSGGAMTLTSVGGNIVLTGADGATTTLDVNADTDLTLGTIVTDGANNPNLAIESDGGVTLADVALGTGILSVEIDANDNGSATASLAGITSGGVVASGGTGDTITLGGPVSTSTASGVALTAETVNINDDIATAGGGGLGVTNSGTFTVANGTVIDLDGAFGQAGAGPVSFGGVLITTDDNVVFTGPVTLTADSSISTGAGVGNVDFGGSLNGDFTIDVGAGTGVVTFAGPVGDVTPLSGLNVTSSGGIAFGGDVAADDEGILLTSSGDITLDRAFTITNAGAFTIDNTGALIIDPAAVFALTGDFVQSGTGPVLLSTDFGTPGLRSTFMGAVTLANDVVLRGSEFTFGGTVDSDSTATPRSVTFETTGFTALAGNLGGTNPLRSLTSSTAGVTRLAGSVTTTSGSVFRNPVVLTGDAVVTDTSADSEGIFFNSTIDGDGNGAHSLTVLVNNQQDANDADIPVIRFGANVGATEALGSLLLNFSQAAGFTPRTNIPLVATITAQPLDAGGNPIPIASLPDFAITFNTTGDFRMGQNEKFTALGDLTINSSAGTVRIGDITALRNLTINAPTIRVLSRGGARLVARDGSSAQEDSDAGTDLVVGEAINFSTSPGVEGGGTVRLTTPTGGNINTVPDGFIALAFEGEFVPQLFVLQSDPTRVLDLRAEGVSTQNIAQAIAGAVPRETRANDVGQNPTVSQAQLRRLEDIGIYARDLSTREVIEFLTGRALYYDYPRKADPAASDYQVSRLRLSADRITALLDMYDEVLRQPAVDPMTGQVEVDEQGNPVLVDRTQDIRQSLAGAAGDYRNQTGAGRIDPIALRAFIEARPEYGELATDLDNIGRFLDALDQVGLSPRETLNARRAILQKLAPPGLDPEAPAAMLEQMIRGEQPAELQ